MTETDYIFKTTQFDSELQRLRMLEQVSDPGSHRQILATGLTQGWQCLEVGAGAGSIMRWMSEIVGESGKIVAVDIDTRFIKNISLANTEIIENDVSNLCFADNSFDLIHIRNVLIHLLDYKSVLVQMLKLLKPNGWIVLEEPDFSAARFISGTWAEQQSVDNVNRAIYQMFSQQGKDFALGIKLPSLLQQLGLRQLDIENDAPISCGASDIATMMKLSAQQLSAKYIATGLANKTDIEIYCQFAQKPTSWGIYLATVRVSGQKQS